MTIDCYLAPADFFCAVAVLSWLEEADVLRQGCQDDSGLDPTSLGRMRFMQ